MAYGTALASFNVEEFGTERVARLSAGEINAPGRRAAADHRSSSASRCRSRRRELWRTRTGDAPAADLVP